MSRIQNENNKSESKNFEFSRWNLIKSFSSTMKRYKRETFDAAQQFYRW